MRDDGSNEFKKPNHKSTQPSASDIDALKRRTVELMGAASALQAVVLFVRAAGKASSVECGAENAVAVTFDSPHDAAEFTAVLKSLMLPAEQPGNVAVESHGANSPDAAK